MGEVAAGGGDGAAGVGIDIVSEKTQRDSPKSTAAKCALRLRGRAPEKRATDRRDHSAQNDNSSNVSAGFYAL
jgi:hypothetical protein